MKRKCKSCKTEIDDKAVKCPHCQADQRGWFRRHPILTGIGALLLFSFIVGSSTGDKNNTTKQEATNVVVPTSKQTETNVANPTPTKTPQEILEETLSNTIKKAGSNMSYRSIEVDNADPDRPKDTKMITVSVNVASFYNKSSLLRTTGKVSSGVFQDVFSDLTLNAYDVIVWYYGETTDKYGNKKDTIVLTYALNKPTYDKINWQNFDQSDLCNFLKQEASGTFDTACNGLVNIQ